MTTKYEAPKLPDGYYFNVRENLSSIDYMVVEIHKKYWYDFIYGPPPILDLHVDMRGKTDIPKAIHNTMLILAKHLPARLKDIKEARERKDRELAAKQSVMGKYPPKKVIG